MKASKIFWLVVCLVATPVVFFVHHRFSSFVFSKWKGQWDSVVYESSTAVSESSLQEIPSSLDPSVTPRTIDLKNTLNPGCLSQKLEDYKPVFIGKHYFHPAIVHYAKLSKLEEPVELIFRDFISMMSMYKFIKPGKILIHTYGDIVGKYWSKVKRWKGVSVEVVKHERLNKVGGKAFQYMAHEADYIRLEALLHYGGIITDFDVIVLNGTRLKEMQLISECIISKEESFLNIGFISCITNSSYIRRWLVSYDYDFKPESYLYNSGYKPKHLLEEEKGPECCNCLIEDTICFNPSNRKDDKIKWLWKNGVHWRNKTAAHYFQKADFKYDDYRLLNADHSMGEMFRFVYNSQV